MVGGWTVAAGLQRQPFDPVSEMVSALMAVGATDRWVMTTALLAVGTCYIVTGAALRPAATAGRLVLIASAAAGMLVAVSPEPAVGASVSHTVWAVLGFAGLAAWPAWAWRRGSAVPWGLRPWACFGAVAVELILLAWFAAELITGAGQAYRHARDLPTRAIGQPALVLYLPDYLPDSSAPIWRANCLVVLTLRDNQIRALTRFGNPGPIARFGFPRTLPRD
jgi:Protein of unknown function (DUF998)